MPQDRSSRTGQEAIVEALQSGRASGDAAPLKRIDTHMSHLFLGPRRVYKLKRAVRHAFADMTTLDARRRACEAELAVNRPLAPELYEAVAPVVIGEDGAIRVGGAGEVVDFVVEMRRFEDGALLSEIADAGRLTPELARAAAEVAARFHAQLPARADAGHAADYRRVIAGLRRTEAQGAAAIGASPGSASLFDQLEHELARRSPLIEARREGGWVRPGHGDLHLRNICLFEGRVTPFDALEFDPALTTTDVIYDVAFLLMDLRARGLDQLANLAMNRYWDASSQPEAALALLPLFCGLRAAVRMAVAVEAGDLVEAGRYRRLGLALLAPVRPVLVAIGGLSGTGKSALAQAIGADLPGACGARILRSDVVRKALAGALPTERLASEAYSPDRRAAIYRHLAERAQAAMRAGASAIVDATFQADEARSEIERAAAGHPFAGIWLSAPTSVRLARVGARRGDASDATPEVAASQVEPDRLGPAWRRLDADQPLEALAAQVR
jgi:hypothetical protein